MTTNQTKPTAANKIGGNNNPFARALAEYEKSSPSTRSSSTNELSNSMLSNPLLGRQSSFDNNSTPAESANFQEEMARQKQKEALRQQSQDQISPSDRLKTLFDSQRESDKNQLNVIRERLAVQTKMVKSTGAATRQIEIEVMKEVTDPGIGGGKYYYERFRLIQSSIDFLKRRPNLSSSWGATHKNKQRKRGKFTTGVDMSRGSKSAHDTMHHEVSAAYSS